MDMNKNGDCLRKWGVLGRGGQRRKNWENYNIIINKIHFFFKKAIPKGIDAELVIVIQSIQIRIQQYKI